MQKFDKKPFFYSKLLQKNYSLRNKDLSMVAFNEYFDYFWLSLVDNFVEPSRLTATETMDVVCQSVNKKERRSSLVRTRKKYAKSVKMLTYIEDICKNRLLDEAEILGRIGNAIENNSTFVLKQIRSSS